MQKPIASSTFKSTGKMQTSIIQLFRADYINLEMLNICVQCNTQCFKQPRVNRWGSCSLTWLIKCSFISRYGVVSCWAFIFSQSRMLCKISWYFATEWSRKSSPKRSTLLKWLTAIAWRKPWLYDFRSTGSYDEHIKFLLEKNIPIKRQRDGRCDF